MTPQENYSPSAARDSHSPCSNSENSARAPADQAKSIAKPRAITCFKCGKSGHVASACDSDARSARKCYACGGIGHIARVCPTRAAQKAANACSFTSGAVACTCKSAGQLFSEAVINGVRVADALVDTGSALSTLSAVMYARLLEAPAIQPFLRAAPEVVGVGGASAVIRGYVDVPVKIAGVAVRHPLLVEENLAFPLIINTDILRAHRAVLTLDESAPVRLQIREYAVCREQRTASPAEPLACARAAPQRPILRAAPPPLFKAPPRQAQSHPNPASHAALFPPPVPAQPAATSSHSFIDNKARRKARHNPRSSASQPLVSAA